MRTRVSERDSAVRMNMTVPHQFAEASNAPVQVILAIVDRQLIIDAVQSEFTLGDAVSDPACRDGSNIVIRRYHDDDDKRENIDRLLPSTVLPTVAPKYGFLTFVPRYPLKKKPNHQSN